MPLIQTSKLGFSGKAGDGSNQFGVPGGYGGELVVSELMARYASLVKSGKVFSATAIVTAPVIFSTAAGTGGPLIWNPPTSGIDVHVLAAGFSTSVVTTVAGGIGLTGNSGQISTPSATTAIDASGNCYVGGPNSGTNQFRVGTVTNAGNRFVPFAQFHTGALTVDTTGLCWVPIDGLFIAPPGSWVSPAGSATLTTLVVTMALIWAELPA